MADFTFSGFAPYPIRFPFCNTLYQDKNLYSLKDLIGFPSETCKGSTYNRCGYFNTKYMKKTIAIQLKKCMARQVTKPWKLY